MGSVIKLRSGATENDIADAFKAANDGDTILLPKDQTITISSGLNLSLYSRSITIDLNGSTLQQGGNNVVLAVWGKHSDVASAKIGKNAAGAVTVTYADAKSVSVGDYVKVFSDDKLPHDQGAPTRLGQAMKVTAVNGNTLTLAGTLHDADLYKTNVRAASYDDAKFVITNGTIRGDQSHSSWAKNLLDVRSTVNAQVDHVVVRDGNAMGINFVDSVNGLVTQSAAINLIDNTSKGNYGYGVHSASSLNTTVEGFYAEKVRHATDNNAVGIRSPYHSPSKYGADIGFTVSDLVAVGTTSHALSWHSEGRHSSVTDSLVFDSFGVLGARGVDNMVANVSGAGNSRGIVFFEYGDGDGRRISVSNLHLKETTDRPYFNQGNATQNTIKDSFFEVLSDKVKILPTDSRTTITNTEVKVGLFAVNEEITGTGGMDRILGARGDDYIDAKGGKDYIWGGTGKDYLVGGPGSDRFAYLNVNEAGDTIEDFTTGSDGDVIDVSGMWYHYGWRTLDQHVRFVQSGTDTLFQVNEKRGASNWVTMATLLDTKAGDIKAANVSTNIVVSDNGTIGGGKIDSSTNDQVELPPHFDELAELVSQMGTSGNDNLLGTKGNDLLIGGAGDDVLTGFGGDDVLVGGAGADVLRGSSGMNIASYADSSAGLTVSLQDPRVNTGDAKGDVYYQIRGLAGSEFADKLIGTDSVNLLSGGAGDDVLYGLGGTDELDGGAGNDRLYGGDKNDVLIGGDGDDWLFGEGGYDIMTGGAGADRFYIDGPNGTYDKITDFEHGTDKLALSRSEYKVQSLGDIDLVSGRRPMAETKGATLLYNTESGQLWWDPDGSGSKAAVYIAELLNAPDFSLGDIVLI
jgi:Ca2+-binding RTX toxin-like protein